MADLNSLNGSAPAAGAEPQETPPPAADAAAANKRETQSTTVVPGAIDRGALTSKGQLVSLMREMRLANKGALAPLAPHAFWDTQPVPKLNEPKEEGKEGPIETKTLEEVRAEPYKLPDGFVWCECDVQNAEELQEVYELLSQHYVEDDDNLFRFNYSANFLDWALTAPGCHRDWVIGVRVASTKKLVGFITATPSRIHVFSHGIPMAEVNFLCVHKKLRSKRLAPVLIKEITRRVNLRNVWQAVYTAGVVLPTPVAQCRYWHRSLNPKKLIEVGFSGLSERMTISRSIKLYRVKETPSTPGLRPAKKEDVPQIHKLLSNYLKSFKLYCEFTEEEVAHWLLPRDGVIHVYVRANNKGHVTDMTSFYELPSSVIGNQKYKEIKAAYSFYNVATTVPLKDLIDDALCLAKQLDFDVYNALDVMENRSFVEELKFGIGDGFLRYYIYNWRCPEMKHSDVGFVLL
ncbi:myristoyl CoA:protein N-myristoyltransferase [Besnoitia besnoiti]|uniref:Glycylpeptide N-tetradecanoyltransferase n=1 Tax=Besnoitia besnoiti TaxID=94643 RepID=A0A2A9M873_BESBE|nr:myristoyl CoA:protein N-myristoyltransferase [Besnoitia besnoiti]PFH31847.1 myristoyl CoA:protein N-myristoyltransferase [Besnoitia besnoiti]